MFEIFKRSQEQIIEIILPIKFTKDYQSITVIEKFKSFEPLKCTVYMLQCCVNLS